MIKPPRNPYFWLVSFLAWFGMLWFLSSESHPLPEMPPIDNIDKVEHFGYFFGGGGLLSAFLFCLRPDRPKWLSIFLTVLAVFAIVGCIDEYHQTFTPGRSGNDPFDWMADISGAICGFLVFKRLHHLLKA